MQTKSKPFVIPIFIPHAGCPHRCIFCNQTRATSQPEELPTSEKVHETINRFLGFRRDPGRYTEISYYGGNFLGLAPETIQTMLALANQYVLQGDVQGIRFSTRPDTIDQDRILLIREFPVTTIELGAQTLNDKLLEISRRGHTVEQIHHAVERLRENPYRLGLQMMVGLPGENAESSLATAGQIAALAPDFVRIYPTLVLKGSRLASWYRQGRYTPLTLEEAVMRVKALYTVFYRHDIAVVRMGLQPTEELNDGAGVVAGPFHPAFGELVRAALWRDVLQNAFQRIDPRGRKPIIQVHPERLSIVKGNKNSNIDFILNEYHLPGIEIHASDNLPPDTILINGESYVMLEV